MTVAGILFDKDGTLIDYAATWDSANWRAAYFFADGNEALAERLMVAGGWDSEAGRVMPGTPLIAATVEEIAVVWSALLPPHKRDEGVMAALLHTMMATDITSQPLVDLEALFGRLRSDGMRLGIATNDSEAGAEATLRPLDIMHHLDFVAGYDSGHGAKPAPGMVLAFAEHLKVDPTAVMMVGDSSHDLEAGRAAGAISVGVLTGSATEQDLAPFADHILADVDALPGLIATLVKAAT